MAFDWSLSQIEDRFEYALPRVVSVVHERSRSLKERSEQMIRRVREELTPTLNTFVMEWIDADIIMLIMKCMRTIIDGLQVVLMRNIGPTPKPAKVNDTIGSRRMVM
jgi:hypothetical protein